MLSSFRLKIVLWYSVVVLSTLLVFRFVSEEVIRDSLYEDLDNSLRGEVEWMRNLLEAYKTKNLPDDEIREEIDTRSILSPRKEYIEIYDVAGAEYFRSSDLELDELRPLGHGALSEAITIPEFRNRPLRLIAAKDSTFEIYVGYPMTDIDAAIDKIASSFVLLIPVTLVLIFAGGLFLVSRFMQPIQDLNRYADELLQQPLDEELPQIPVRTKDEMGALIMRINAVIEKMRSSMRQALGFSSLASHELRTPLAVMRNQLESALRPEVATEVLHQTVASTYDEILRLNRIVDDLLSLSTMEAGTLKLQRQPQDFQLLLKEFHEEAKLLAGEKNITVLLDEAPPAQVAVDVLRIRQMLFNLLDNAIKHTPPGGWIRLGYKREGHGVLLQFSDTGTGIPASQLLKIFDTFYRASSNDSGPQGAGLGLALVRWIVAAHQGDISVESKLNQGTTFIIRLPLAEALAK
ncbi:HAMP domain-containing histidine kinase [candidate division KSB1 bacterium]|nr:HAMP domain-containing histidine kinase [candidate division KSB1 bacterium]